MNRVKRIYSIIYKDFIESFHNKTVLIVILLPVLASLLFSIVDNSEMNKVFQIGVVENEKSSLIDYINKTTINLRTTGFSSKEKGITALETGQIESLVIIENGFTVYLDSSQSITYFFLKDSLENIIGRYLNKPKDFNIEFIPVNIAATKLSFLPVWIVITMTMIGVLIISGNLAEEKENKTLYSILMTPVNKFDILLAKIIFGIIFIFITVMIMCLLNGVYIIGFKNIIKLIFSVLISGVCFSSIGLLIGSFADSQSSARSIGTIIYFPLLFPTLIADLSSFTELLARFVPTYYFYRILEKIIIYKGEASLIMELSYLMGFSIVLFSISYFRFKRVY